MALRAAPYTWQAVMARAESQRRHNTITTGWGMCLYTSRVIYGLPVAGLPTATSAIGPTQQWHHDRNGAKGGHGLFSGGSHGYGHSVIMAGGDRCYSVDIGGSPQLYLTTIGAIERAWGLRWIGWSTDYAGRYQLGVQGYNGNGVKVDVVVIPDGVKRKGTVHTTSKLNGRTAPSTTAAVRVVRPKNYPITYTSIVKVGGRTWLRTLWGTFYAAEYTTYKAV